MPKEITVTFDKDIPDEQLEELREKIRKVLRGEAVPEAEVVGQWNPNDPSGGRVGRI
jgi:hypothetical protein